MNPFTRFAKDRSGNFAVITGLITPLILVAMGGAVDATQALRTGTRLQHAVDAAALAAGRLPKDRLSEAKAVAKAYFVANFREDIAIDVKVVGSSKVVVSASLDVPTSFLRLIDMKAIGVSRTSEVTMATNTREIAFVLDTTGSMSTGRRMPDMKSAVTRITNELSVAGVANGTDTRFSVVPFSSFVNVKPASGVVPAFVDTKGVANPAMSDFPTGLSRLDLYKHLGQTWKGCVEARSGGLDVLDTEAKANVPNSMFAPAFSTDEPDPLTFYGIPLRPHYPNDYLVDNEGSQRLFDLNNNFAYHGRTSPTGTLLGDVLRLGLSANSNRFKAAHHPLDRYGVTFNASGVVSPAASWRKVTLKRPFMFYSNQTDDQGPNFGCEVDPVIPLTVDAKKITNAVAALEPRGSTNIAEGLAWGWRTLSPGEPYTEGRRYDDEENDKILVLLTDGANDMTMLSGNANHQKGSAYSGYGYLWDGGLRRRNGQVARTAAEMKEAMNDRTLQICTNVKKAGIRIFTVMLEVNDAATATLLEKCATSPDQFYDAKNSSRLEEIFEDIKGKISRLRISK